MEYRKNGKMAGFLAVAIGMALAATGCTLPEIDIVPIDFASLSDGSYEGSYKAEMGSASVRVGVSGGRVIAIDLLALDASPIGEPARVMPERVVEGQSLDVDTVSGATYSCKVILKAIENALTSGNG